jgi:hypothetical protein
VHEHGPQRADAREARQRECKDGAVSNGEPCDKHADCQQVGNTAEASQPAFDAGSTVDLTQFTYSFSIFILAMVVLGGLGSIWVVVVGAIILTAINHYLLPRVLYGVPITLGLDFDLSRSRPASMASRW